MAQIDEGAHPQVRLVLIGTAKEPLLSVVKNQAENPRQEAISWPDALQSHPASSGREPT